MQNPVSESTSRINRLSLQLANQIAAGEVVERPASVVKELLENALDAGSQSIVVDILNGGLNLIRVRDDGNGIDKNDMHLAVSRHATSKLHSLTELENISSLGFRGEALASISSVSRLALHSKSSQINSKAWCIDTGNDGDFANYKAELIPSALPNGTMLEVRDLFFNTPARRKFLRAEKTEFRYIEDVFKRIAMSFYDVSFQLTHNKKLIKKLPAVNNYQGKLQRLQKIFGIDFCQAATSVDCNSQDLDEIGRIHLWGWVANPDYLRNQANQQYFYVNGRFVRDKLLNHAIRQVFQELIPADRYPAYVLYLEIEPSEVDVNVHPTKHEVRFRHARLVHDFIVSAINQAIGGGMETNSIVTEQPQLNNSLLQPEIKAYDYRHHLPQRNEIKENLEGLQQLYKVGSPEKTRFPQNNVNIEDKKPAFTGQVLTILFQQYLLAEVNEQLWLIDLHSCLPLINYNALTKTLDGSEKLSSTRLLIPESVKLSAKEIELLQKYQALLQEDFGIDFSQNGPDSIMLRQVANLPFKVSHTVMFKAFLNYINTALQRNQDDWTINKNEVADVLSGPVDLCKGLSQDKKLNVLDFVHRHINDQEIKKCLRCLNHNDLEKLISTAP